MSEINTATNPQMYVADSETVGVDPAMLTQLTEDLHIEPRAIVQTSILIENRPNELYKGSHTPKWLDRKLNGKQSWNEGEGSVVRIATRRRGKDLTDEEMNQTLVHELEHVAQHSRKDAGMKVGNGAIWGFAAMGAGMGRELAKDKGLIAKVIIPLGMAAIGQQVGYKLAPHERGARRQAQQITTTEITRRA